MKDRRVTAGNIELQIREYEGQGQAVIFLHFGGGNLMMWQEVVPYFQDYHLLLFDLKGHGKSDKPAKGYHIDELAHEVVQAMDVLQVERAHVVGSSLGAEVGLSMAVNSPDRVRSLVCDGALHSESGPYGLWEGTEEEFKEHAARVMEKQRSAAKKVFPSIEAVVAESQQTFEQYGWWNEIFESVKRYDAIKLDGENYTNSWGRIAADYTSNYLSYRFEDYYRQVKCPVLMISEPPHELSEREREVMAELLALVEHGEMATVPGWVHPFGWMLTPESASQVVLDFLAAVSS